VTRILRIRSAAGQGKFDIATLTDKQDHEKEKMRNLRNIRYETWRSPPEYEFRQISATAWDNTNDEVIVAYGPSENDTLVELVRVARVGGKSEYVLAI
jgi:hypothetical protein